jgi:hypothetical protein
MLSPAGVILAAIGERPGKVIVHPDVVDVALRTYVVGVVSPVAGTERTFHFPAKSARLTGAGAVVTVLVLEEAIVLLVSVTAALSFLAQPARTAAQQQIAMRVERCSVDMEPPV